MPRTRRFVAALLLLAASHPAHAQIVNFGSSSQPVTRPSAQAPIGTVAATQASAPVIYNDLAVAAAYGRFTFMGSQNLTSTAAQPADVSRPTPSLAAAPANVDPYFSTSINPIPNSSPYLTPVSLSTASTSSNIRPALTSHNWRFGSTHVSSPSTLPSLPPILSVPAAPSPGLGLARPIASSFVTAPSSLPLVGVPEPGPLALGALTFVAGALLYHRRRAANPNRNPSEPSVSPPASTSS